MKSAIRIAMALAGASAMALPASAQTVGFATLPPGALYNITAQVMSKVVQEKSGLKMRVLPFRGGAAVHAAVNGRRAAFGVTEVASLTTAYEGRDEFKGRAMKNLRVALRLRPLTVGFYVRKDSNIKTLKDIKGKRFPTKWSAFPNAIPLSLGIMATAGIGFKDVNGVPVTNIIRAADDFKSGKLDVAFFAIGAPKMTEVNSAVGGIRFLPLETSPEAIAAMKKVRPDYYVRVMKPSPINAGILEPTPSLSVDTVISVGAHVPDEVVAKFIDAVLSSKAELVKGHPLFRAYVPEEAGKHFAIARHHPGAIAYFKKKGMWKGK